jgi:predicted ribosome quality control (RQC) complex YloA/Tae2 family protein
MVSNYYTLRHVALDLNRLVTQAEIKEIFCQNKNELIISCRSGERNPAIVLSCEPSSNFLFLRDEIHRARKNSVDVFPRLRGGAIERVEIQPMDREIVIHGAGDLRLVFQLFGSKANALLLNKANRVMEAFLRPKEVVGTVHLPRRLEPSDALESIAHFSGNLQAIGTIMLSAALKKLVPSFGGLLIREVCHRAGVREGQLVAELTEADRSRLYSAIIGLIKELEGPPSPRIYCHDARPIAFSVIRLDHLRGSEEETFDSIHDAIRAFVGRSRRRQLVVQEKEALRRFLGQGIERAERTLSRIVEETQVLERATQYERFGKLLMANLPRLTKGMRQATIENVFDPGRAQVAIPLEPRLTPAQNAERYFDKAKKARAGVGEKLDRQELVREKWELLRELHDRLSPVETMEQFGDFVAENKERLAEIGYQVAGPGPDAGREPVPFRAFTVTGGFQVWAGKSSENNDLLTMKYAKPNDLWFHARGSSGSHVVLRVGTGRGEPSKQAIHEAAGIAAYYSKMKGAKHVPVAVTERKYVRKPKGAQPGTVTIEREKLLFVEPGLPAAEHH